jgi:aminoglycoside 2'-N-acetyltransferase I
VTSLHVESTEALGRSRVQALRELLTRAYEGDFGDDDWVHATGGLHVWLEDRGEIVGHAALVPRTLRIADVPMQVGYVEAVATEPSLQRRGIGTRIMRRIGELIVDRYALGALSTGEHAFYAPLGWERWQGETFVDSATGPIRTPEDDDSIMVLTTARSPAFALDAAIVADAREGDPW